MLPIALVTLELDDFADVRKRQVERRLPKLLHELAGVYFVASRRQLLMDCEAHVVSLALIVQHLGQRVTQEMTLAAPPPPTRRSGFRAEPVGRR